MRNKRRREKTGVGYHNIFTNKKKKPEICLSVCLSSYYNTFRRALIDHAEILDSDQGHIFRKYRRKNNKKVSLIYEKTVKTARYQGICRQLLCI